MLSWIPSIGSVIRKIIRSARPTPPNVIPAIVLPLKTLIAPTTIRTTPR